VLLVVFNEPVLKLLWSATFLVNYKTEYLDGLNSHLWSLCVEVQFYAAIAVVVLVFGSRAVWLVWPACFIITWLRIDAGAFIDIRTHYRVDEILAGACVACVFIRYGKKKFSLPIATLPLAVLVWGMCSLVQGGELQYARPYTAALVVVAAIWTNPGTIKSYLSSGPAHYVAEISYALYVIHPVTAYGWMNEGSTQVRYLLKRPASFLIMFWLAHLSTFYWENIWTARAKKWLFNQKSRPQLKLE
jgi:peptidoglycan/LPS O-acetylase OafA/YrhL